MSDPVRFTGSMPATRQQQAASPQQQPRNSGTDLADILERVLDKGIVIAGDIQINLLDIELLTIKLRLVVASVDRAKEMGIDWWERDPTLSSGHKELEEENRRLRERLETLERRGLPGSDEDDAEVEGQPVDDEDDLLDDDVEDAELADDEAHGSDDGEPARRGNGARRSSGSSTRRRPARGTDGRR